MYKYLDLLYKNKILLVQNLNTLYKKLAAIVQNFLHMIFYCTKKIFYLYKKLVCIVQNLSLYKIENLFDEYNIKL